MAGQAGMALCLLVHSIFLIASLVTTYSYWTLFSPTRGALARFYYLTFWSICLQTIYYGLCVVTNFTSDRRRSSQLQRWRDNMHSCLAFPVGMFVVATFWALFAIDRELHTAVCPFLVIDKYLVYHQYPVRHKGIPTACGLALIYLAWILFIAYYEGFWVYPILQVLAMHERAIFIGVCIMFFASFYILGEALTKFIWRKEVQAKLSSKSKLK
ncbi:androgen-induced protein 1 [Elysia marginata]|uniref:Androgen-induced protein 1 n=1 Tax=Elysia marginata TaxID=1093978 RepID=A0AAV4I4J0_9GAST|nr:androgen-induced protein 1 [Elysia marginata]